jgi:Zn finger protein HypA/HybF involved in hydrogenase expression
MTKNIDSGWLSAAIQVENNPKANVLCPKCGEANLNITNVKDTKNPRLLIERILTCPLCKAMNAILVNRETD